jgi:hypothetical protein
VWHLSPGIRHSQSENFYTTGRTTGTDNAAACVP